MTERMTNRTERILDPFCGRVSDPKPLPPKRPPQNQQVTALPRSHRTDESRLYVQKAIEHTLAKVEADTEPLTKKQWADYERLRQLVRMYRQAGRMNWVALWWAFGTAAAVSIILYAHRPKDILYCSAGCNPPTTVRVLEQYNDFDFLLQLVVDGVPQQPEVHRFHEKLPLEIGFTLTKLQVEDKGDYWTTGPFRLPYIIQRYPGTVMPTLPDNCHQDPQNPIYGRVICSGRPNFKY